MGPLVDMAPLPDESEDSRDPRKFDAALIIGLGATGSAAIRAFVRRLEQDPAGYQELLRPILLTMAPEEEIVSSAVHVRQFDLLSCLRGDPRQSNRSGSRRANAEALFRNPVVFSSFSDYLNAAVTELSSDEGHAGTVRVFIIASALEQEVGMLGPVLQMLRLMAARDERPLANFSLLLSLWSPNSSLEAKEMFAAMREISRFTFSGSWHWMPELPLREQGRSFVKGSLIDYVFLVEATTGRDRRVDLRSLPFENGVGQVLTDTLHLLLHKSGHNLWENVRNDLSETGRLQSETRRPFVHSLAMATLYVPISEIQDYEASRLAYAAMFGEQEIQEGLLPQVKLRRSQMIYTPGREARRWLRERHMVFRWLLEAESPRQVERMPAIDLQYYEEFAALLPSDVAFGIVELLNDLQQIDHLGRARSELIWLIQRVKDVRAILESSSARPKETRELLFDLAVVWQQSLTNLLEQVEQWQKTLLTGANGAVSVTSAKTRPQTAVFEDDDIFGGISIASVGRPEASEPSSPTAAQQPVGDSLLKRLKARRAEAEAVLAAVSSNPIRQSLTADGDQGVSEAEKHYIDTIRPELRHGEDHGESRYERVRERLRWWADTRGNRVPQLMLLCVPPDLKKVVSDGLPVDFVQFLPQNGEALYETIMALACNQVQDIEKHLSGTWMRERLQDGRFRDFLETADQPFLTYDQVHAAEISPLAGSSRRYLIGHSKTTTNVQKKMAFPNVTAANVNELNDDSAAYLIALGLTLNIPLESVKAIKGAEGAYGYHDELHIYPQEKIATGYEIRLRGAPYQFPPELIMPFTDSRLVSLFCQAVFHDLIRVETPRSISGRSNDAPYWMLPSFADPADPLDEEIEDSHLRTLASPETYRDRQWMSLFISMRTFTLDAALDPYFDRNPAHPLHPDNYVDFTDRLFAAARQTQRDSQKSKQLKQAFEKEYLEPWQKQIGNDLLGCSFLDLLQLELIRPLWRGW